MQTLQGALDAGKDLPFPDGLLINGQTGGSFTGDQGNLPKSKRSINCFFHSR